MAVSRCAFRIPYCMRMCACVCRSHLRARRCRLFLHPEHLSVHTNPSISSFPTVRTHTLAIALCLLCSSFRI